MSDMEIICDRRCIIGEGPLWNERDGRVYFVNGYENEVLSVDIETRELNVKKLPPPHTGVAAVAFGKNGDLILSRDNGVFILRGDEYIPLYDTEKYSLLRCNDMKVGPDGRIYVGTLSEKKCGISDKVNGKLYSIDKDGAVRVLLDGIGVSNGMAWSGDGKRYYYTDSDTKIIKEYDFDIISGDINFTGRQIYVAGVDGFTIDVHDRLFAACWGQGHIAVVDTEKMEIVSYIDVPAKIPASCSFAGKELDRLVIVSATWGIPEKDLVNDGMTFMTTPGTKGVLPFLFDTENKIHK